MNIGYYICPRFMPLKTQIAVTAAGRPDRPCRCAAAPEMQKATAPRRTSAVASTGMHKAWLPPCGSNFFGNIHETRLPWSAGQNGGEFGSESPLLPHYDVPCTSRVPRTLQVARAGVFAGMLPLRAAAASLNTAIRDVAA